MKIIIALLLIFYSICATAQQPGQRFQLPDALCSFFCGKWQGEGQFSNGKSISADVFIHYASDSSWLMYEHTDKAPNRYKAVSLWGVEKNSGQFLAFTFLNSQGHTQFDSDGWKNNKLVLTAHQFIATANRTWWQRFIYQKITEFSFKMTYETSADGNVWKMGDYLVFAKIEEQVLSKK